MSPPPGHATVIAVSLLLALAASASADIVYTDAPDHNLHVPGAFIDLDGDGAAELESEVHIADWFKCLCAGTLIVFDPADDVKAARGEGVFAVGLHAGAPVDGSLNYAGGAFQVWESWGACCDDPPYCLGDWCDEGVTLSVGVRFPISGKEHYGWVRLRNVGPFEMYLLDYAYESEPLTSLPAGMAFHDCNGNGVPDADDITGGASDDVNGNGVPDECECPDTDGDGMVGVDDLVNVLLDWGCGGACAGDANGDGVVDVDDLVAVVLSWGPCT